MAEILQPMGKSDGIISTAGVPCASPPSNHTSRAHEQSMSGDCTADVVIAPQLADTPESRLAVVAKGSGQRPALIGSEDAGTRRVGRATGLGAQPAIDTGELEAPTPDGRRPRSARGSRRYDAHDRTDPPSLADMTEAAIACPSRNDVGHFIAVEAGLVDHASHDDRAALGAGAITDETTVDDDTLNIVDVVREHSPALRVSRTWPERFGAGDTVARVDGEQSDELVLGDCGRLHPIVGLLNGPRSDPVRDVEEGEAKGRSHRAPVRARAGGNVPELRTPAATVDTELL